MYKKAVIGGSFDHFHKGHKSFLDYSLSAAESLVIGVTSDEYLKRNKNGLLEGYGIRSEYVSSYLNVKNISFEIVKINDIYGTTLDPSFDAEAIIATSETAKGANEINRAREEKGLPSLQIILAEFEKAEDGRSLSSERIRKGEIDREGRLYIKPEWLDNALYITTNVTPDLKTPFGELMPELSASELGKFEGKIFAVGDETTKQLIQKGIIPHASFVDFKIARRIKFSKLSELGIADTVSVIKLKNPSGTLTPDLFKAASKLTQAVDEQTAVLIDGEDDLCVLPIVLSGRLGDLVFYGQPNEGIVKVLIDENHKAKAREIVAKFTTRGH